MRQLPSVVIMMTRNNRKKMAKREELRTAPHLLPRDSKLQAHPARWMIRLIHLPSSMVAVGAVVCVWPNKKESESEAIV